MSEISVRPMGDHVPRIIHQVYSRKTDLPPEIEENIKHLQGLNPNWEYRLYDDADMSQYIFDRYGVEILNLYEKINPEYGVARADFFRYLLVYAEGGIYLDIKSSLTRPLDDVITSDMRYVLSQWNNHVSGPHPNWGLFPELAFLEGGEYQQFFIIAVPGHPFLKNVIERVVQNIRQSPTKNFGSGLMGVLRITGTIAYTKAIYEIQSRFPHTKLNVVDDLGFVYSIYSKTHGSYGHKLIFKNDYAKLESRVILLRTCRDYYLYQLARLKKNSRRQFDKFRRRIN